MRFKSYIISLWIIAALAGSIADAREIYSDYTENDPVEIKKVETDQKGQPVVKQELPPEVNMIFRYATAFSPRLLKGQGTQADVDRYMALLADDPNEMELISLLLTMTAKNQKLREGLMDSFQKMVDADPGLPCLAVITAERFFIKKDYAQSKRYLSIALPYLTRPEVIEKAYSKRDVNYQLTMSAITKYMDCSLQLNQLDDLIALENKIVSDKKLARDPDLLIRSINCYFGAANKFKSDQPVSFFVPTRREHSQKQLDLLLNRYADAWTDPASTKIFSLIKDQVHLHILGIMNKQKKLDRLNVNLKKFHKAHPNNRLAMYMLAGIYTVQKKHADAAKMWKGFLSGQKNAPPALYMEYARALRRAKNFNEALKAYDLLIAMTPADKQLPFKIEALEAAWEGKLYKTALQRIDKGFRRTEILYHQLIMMTHIRRKDNRAAYRSAQNAIRQIHAERVKEVPLQFWILCADVAEKNKDLKLVEEILLEQLKKHPKNATLLNFLGYAYANHDMKLQEAKKLLTAALAIEPDAPEILDSMAWALYKLKEYEEAKKYILRSLELYKKRGKGDDAVLLKHAGDIFFAAGDKKQACEYWKRAIKMRDPENDSEEVNIKELQRKIDSVGTGK